jgi:hypothetical protein
MKVPILGMAIDERFLNHRLRSTSIAGMCGATVATGLFLYRDLVDRIISWDLFAVGVTMAAVKVAMMAWYRWKD